MAHQHMTEVRESVALQVADDISISAERSGPLRFAVSLTDPQGKMLFRKQFGSSGEADAYAMATAELCPEYKVSTVDRVAGLAYEVVQHSLTITASATSQRRVASDQVEDLPA
jgi:hypothetical protein